MGFFILFIFSRRQIVVLNCKSYACKSLKKKNSTYDIKISIYMLASNDRHLVIKKREWRRKIVKKKVGKNGMNQIKDSEMCIPAKSQNFPHKRSHLEQQVGCLVAVTSSASAIWISFPLERLIGFSSILASKLLWVVISSILVIICKNTSSTFRFFRAEVSMKHNPSASANPLPSSSSTSLDWPRSHLFPTRITTMSSPPNSLSSNNHLLIFS